MKWNSFRKLALLICALLALAPLACHSDKQIVPESSELTVSAAASLREAFQEIGQQYTSRTKTRITFNFGASGALQKQIEAGAPVDVFASAGQPQMDALARQGLIVDGTRQDFARNDLVLIVPADHPNTVQDFTDLGKVRGIKLAMGNPRTVPAGQYAEQALTRLGFWLQLQSHLIFAEDVRQVMEYVSRDEVEAGLVYASDVRTAGTKVRRIANAPADSHDPILYPLAVVRASTRQGAARALIEAILSEEGQSILAKYGFSRGH